MTDATIKENGEIVGRLATSNNRVVGQYRGDNPFIQRAFEDAKGELVITNGSDAERPNGMLHPDESKVLTPSEKIRYVSSVIEDVGGTVEGLESMSDGDVKS